MDLRPYKGQAFTVPNILSYIRFLLIPVFVYCFLKAAENDRLYVLCSAILVASGLTDWLDGIIARKFDQITPLGKLLDPLADKLTCITVAICLCFKLPFVWFLAVIYCLKESAMILGGILLIRRHKPVPGSKWFGKVATAVFYLTMFFLVAVPVLPQMQLVVEIVVLVNMAILTFAFLMYLPIFWKLWYGPDVEEPLKVSQNVQKH